ncbi:hypothetical protein FYJ84_09610 [Veillonellaceae bacterium WCA-693-APC-5D-A]|uniref:Phage tail collar domain-containing protein n=1 Tax=Anaerovibrio slackiae TaxID=2652309 RepID=A0A6I2UI26_9FIRM|nr:hypothetical protein [Anaerovibrio slackiae]MSU09240.1 hypothetical protein [Anaerovibrio slackiae]
MITYNGYWFLWNIIGASQGNNTLPIGTILPYVGELNKIPHGWFLCDGTNGTPDLRDRFLQGSNVPGKFIKAGLPNISGHISAHKMWENVYSTSGALYTSSSSYNQLGHDQGAHGDEISNIFFDASKANPIYGASATVQPSSYTVYYIIRII